MPGACRGANFLLLPACRFRTSCRTWTCCVAPMQVRTSEQTPLISCLLEGPPGTGKTALAATVGIESDFPFVKVISAETMVGYSEASKSSQIAKVFDDAYRVRSCLGGAAYEV